VVLAEPITIEVAAAAPRTGAVIVGAVSVLLVKVSVPAKVANVPVVGRVTFVVPVVVSVLENAPAVTSDEPFANVRVAAVAGAE